jgi:two-component system, OmpR family, sensor kinase
VTLRWRITILTAVMIAVASSLIGVASVVSIAQAQMSAIDSSLQTALGMNPRRILRGDGERGNRFSDVYTPIGLGLIDTEGDLVAVRSAGTPENPETFPTLPLQQLSNAPNQALSFTDQATGEPYRLVAEPVGREFLAVSVTSLTAYNTTMNRILLSTVLLVVGITLLGALASWLIVRRFFTPVDSMIAAAGVIARGDLAHRVPHAAPGTELGDLSASLNTMINSLTASIARIESSELSLRHFISDASHEIRTPLTVIRGYIEILRSHSAVTSERDARALARIDSESQRLERLVTSLLDLDTRQTGASTKQVIDLDQLVALHFADLESIAQRQVDSDIAPITIEGDADGWEQLLGNIVQNITRYTPEDSAVGVELRGVDAPEPDWAELIVNDCGPGIPTEMRAEVFTRFSRLDPSRSTQTGGFGLGMSIMQAVVQAHSGTIDLDQSPCGGLQIRIRVPRRQEPGTSL